MGVAEIGCQQWQPRLHIGLLSVPGGKTRDRETVPQVMRPQSLAAVETDKLAGGAERRL